MGPLQSMLSSPPLRPATAFGFTGGHMGLLQSVLRSEIVVGRARTLVTPMARRAKTAFILIEVRRLVERNYRWY